MSTTSITGAYLEELTGFEPAMTVLQTVSLAYLDTTPENMALSARFELAVQMNGRQVSNLLVSASHQTQHMVAEEGFEPTTFGL